MARWHEKGASRYLHPPTSAIANSERFRYAWRCCSSCWWRWHSCSYWCQLSWLSWCCYCCCSFGLKSCKCSRSDSRCRPKRVVGSPSKARPRAKPTQSRRRSTDFLLERAVIGLNAVPRWDFALTFIGAAQAILEVRSHRFIEHRELGISVDAQPVLGVVNIYQIPHQLLVGLSADVAASTLVRSEHFMIVKRIIHDWVACERDYAGYALI